MITCDKCRKVNGHGNVGDHWICEDCRVGGKAVPDSKPQPPQPKN